MGEELTDEQKKKLNEIIETWETAGRAIKVLTFIGQMIKGIVWLASIIGAAWVYAFHNGSTHIK